MSGQRGEPGGPASQLFINGKVLWVKPDGFERLGVPGLAHGLFKRGSDAFVTDCFHLTLEVSPTSKGFLGFCTKTSKNKHRVI